MQVGQPLVAALTLQVAARGVELWGTKVNLVVRGELSVDGTTLAA